jgi:hypothetical protein
MSATARATATLTLLAGLTLALPSLAATAKDVIVTNPSTAPVQGHDVDNPAFQPFQVSLLPSSSTSGQNAVYFQVPAGKRLVIEYYSAQAQDTTGQAAMTLGTTVNGVFASYIIYVNATTTNQLTQMTRIYADPGTFVQAFAFNGGGATHCGGVITLSGYLVNVPAPT